MICLNIFNLELIEDKDIHRHQCIITLYYFELRRIIHNILRQCFKCYIEIRLINNLLKIYSYVFFFYILVNLSQPKDLLNI